MTTNQATLASNIESIPNITPDQVEIVLSKFKPKRYTKNHFVGREGDTCRFTAYVKKGCVSNYRILDNGKKVINHFAFEDWWVGDLESFLNQNPSKTYWLTLEDTDLMCISKSDFDFIMENIPPFQIFFLKKTQKAFLKEMENADKDKSETAMEKYLRLMKNYPQIILRVPHYEVAAYLGVAPESLSRIRKQITELS
jgi:CRP-like cAMP-binding protein